eukprot:TRINITY_DN12089_c0_g1_i2.p1 TRINITY_DN12089_c0_g1~~TRINITY_DN12089_c0_g1_i2.p1  ORF type:complete len:354 (-),score=78.06 TRINITY_DN12089_c0_g1_i2:115-1137(-)
MDHVRSAAKQASSQAGARLKKAVDLVQEQGYFDPICTERHLSVRHYNGDLGRYVGDFTHLVALALCLAVVLRENGTEGVSFKTHLVYFIVFNARFLNILFCEQSMFLIIYKVLLWTFTLKIVILMWVLGSARDKKDTIPLLLLLVPTFMLTLVFGVYSIGDRGLCVEFLWIFSTYLESVAMLPQYIYCYRDPDNTSKVVSAYVIAMGGYQMVFGLSWAQRYVVASYDLDISSFISGILGIAFFCDYLLFKLLRKSTLARICISVDETLREAEEAALGFFSGDTETQLDDAAGADGSPSAAAGAGNVSPLNRGGGVELELREMRPGTGMVLGKPVVEVEIH